MESLFHTISNGIYKIQLMLRTLHEFSGLVKIVIFAGSSDHFFLGGTNASFGFASRFP